MTSGHLLIIACGAGPAADLDRLIAVAHRHSWTTAVAATAAALHFIDTTALERLTGSRVRSDFRWSEPQQGGRALPPVDALIIAPTTANTVAKLSLGIADTYALTLAAEMIGRGVPTVVVPFANSAFASREPFARAVASLRGEGVHVMSGRSAGWEPHAPGTGPEAQTAFPWEAAFLAASAMAERRLP
ncbi:phosphopantothenoylcysteine synthetase/decarboxylase [Allocatelliglobosispora scoriae]|uniref:Phosphopantothenoylcysteine synthetase/decarboxylase n=1 Tax=Allocatelliglobosispora scoriae TaxID=643052 RepID=A0A841BQQ0_9ACTN|nr:flavoprotein [Allocatelliglobosispora scoriae]MBB5869666.1 phosphopantothenoylcysteine synthetase/decarboxylase [Allocatelliglobosispora scoriae]